MRYEPKLRNAALAAALAFGAVGAWAGGGPLTPYTLDGNTASFSNTVTGAFTDIWTFNLEGENSVGSSITNVSFTLPSFGAITDFAAFLDGEALTLTTASGGGVDVVVLAGAKLLGLGAHSLTVSGAGVTGGSASYGGNIIATPIPEPGTYTMLLAGLGVVGFIAFRRRQDD